MPKIPRTIREEPAHRPMDGELMDLYAAILIVVPLALFIKSLWG